VTLEEWQEQNDAYLGLALAWLRLRLERAAPSDPEPPLGTSILVSPGSGPGDTTPAVIVPAVVTGEAVLVNRRWWRRMVPAPPGSPPGLPPHPLEQLPPGLPSGSLPSGSLSSGSLPSGPPPEPPPLALAAPPTPTVTDAEVEAARTAMDEAAAAMSPPPALVGVAAYLGLSTFERDVLLLCAAVELDTRVPGLCAAVHGSPYPTFALALGLFDDPAWDARSTARPLRFWHLIEVVEVAGHAGSLTTSLLRADERVVNALKGLDDLDERLAPFFERVQAPPAPLPPSQEAVVTATVLRLTDADGPRPSLVELVGPDRAARNAAAASIAARIGLPLYRLPIDLLPTAPTEVDLIARIVRREAVLTAVSLLIDAEDLEERTPAHVALTAFLGQARVLTFLGGRDVRGDLPLPSLLVDIARPTTAEQQAMWQEALSGRSDEVDVSRLVAQFDLDADTIRQVTADAATAAPAPTDGAPSGEAPTDPAGVAVAERSLTDRLWDHSRRHSRPRLEALAQRLETRAGWDQLVLPANELALLHHIADQVGQRGRVYEEWGFAARMNRGLGISALFAGESGTGKTMAAEVLAHELSLDLYRIDLSSVVSKYIGETEKNLRRLFDAAERGGVILFFDEADSLFGKRSEVKDAHDRYANIEISYLLQRMEAYRGLAILATNMKSALDRAFTRRLRFIVDFPFPTASDRVRMWSSVFPPDAPVVGLDVDRLARINLTGAGIHNAALNAAFLAAEAGTDIGMAEVLAASRNELRKLERPINEADFRFEDAVRA